MSPLIMLLSRMLPKDLLVKQLQDAINSYTELPIDDNWVKVSMASTLVAIKAEADAEIVHELLESLAKADIPMFTASAN